MTQLSSLPAMSPSSIRQDWSLGEVESLFNQPLNDLLLEAQQIHREHFVANEVQVSTLLSIKTGGCPEDCGYCSQSAHHDTPVKATKLMDSEAVIAQAKKAKEAGASRFCMGAAWRSVKDRDMPAIAEMIVGVKSLGMETCMTLGMLDEHQAHTLKDAGLDYYNHNLDTSEAFYDKIITTRTYQDRLDTLEAVREAGIKVCCGGIMGLGETRQDRVAFLHQLATLPQHPESVPINQLVRVEGTPLAQGEELDTLEMVRVIAVARILMPASYVRLSAGREEMSDEMQALCFFAGVNSIFYGDVLLTASNPKEHEDQKLFARLGLTASECQA